MSDDRYTRITLRIPKDLHKVLAEKADATSKSMNAEIIARLRDSILSEQEDLDDLERAVQELEQDEEKGVSTIDGSGNNESNQLDVYTEQELADEKMHEALQAVIELIEKKKANKYEYLTGRTKSGLKKKRF